MSTNPASNVPFTGAIVDIDAPCRGCGYNLRGLPIDGRCPECGAMVGVSVQGDLLRFSSPQFVQTLRRGISYILWSMLLMIIVIVLGAILQASAGPRVSPLVQLVMILGYIPAIMGGWLLTSPDPSGVGEDRYGTARKLIRVTLVIGVGNYFLNFVTSIAGPLPPAVRIVFQTIIFLAAIAGLVGQFAQLNYLSKLALRIPDPQLSKNARQIMWGIAISYGLFLLFAFLTGMLLVATARRAGSPGGIMMGAGCFMGIVGIAVIVYAIMYIVMLFKFGAAFEQQAGLAKQIWAQHQAPPAPPVVPGPIT